MAKDDHHLIMNHFSQGNTYFDLLNFKHQSVFHIAGKNNSLLSIKALLGRTVFIEELLKKDFKGDSPLHSAAKSGSLEVLGFYLTACTPQFLEIQNDFGFSPIEAARQKLAMVKEALDFKIQR